jgi:CRP-like cAMP-binding protein
MAAPDSGADGEYAVSLIDRIPDLARDLEPAQVAPARRVLRAPAQSLKRGPWEPGPETIKGGLGFMVTHGFMTREVRIADGYSLEILGPGDLLAPWQEDAVSFSRSRFEALSDVELACLRSDLIARVAHFPGLVRAFVERAVLRSRYMAVYGAIDGIVGVDRRLLALFWALAERWGERRDEHVYLPIALRHHELGRVVAARRPTVSSALAELERAGEVLRVHGGWLLRGSPPNPPG